VRHEGPPLEQLLRRLAECPPDFLPAAGAAGAEAAHVPAVVGDLMRDLGGGRPDPRLLAGFRKLQPGAADAKVRNQARLVLVACWLLHDPWLLQQRRFAAAAHAFLERGLTALAALVQAERFVDDPDRREELSRAALAALDLRPQGESEPQARDRRTTLDSVERHAVLQKTRAAEERARQVREAMAAKAAQEAAASYGRE
jgi:hypothetical protein